MFGNTFARRGNTRGTSVVPFFPPVDPVGECFMSITAMDVYASKSFEQLRFEDYLMRPPQSKDLKPKDSTWQILTEETVGERYSQLLNLIVDVKERRRSAASEDFLDSFILLRREQCKQMVAFLEESLPTWNTNVKETNGRTGASKRNLNVEAASLIPPIKAALEEFLRWHDTPNLKQYREKSDTCLARLRDATSNNPDFDAWNRKDLWSANSTIVETYHAFQQEAKMLDGLKAPNRPRVKMNKQAAVVKDMFHALQLFLEVYLPRIISKVKDALGEHECTDDSLRDEILDGLELLSLASCVPSFGSPPFASTSAPVSPIPPNGCQHQ